MKTLVVYYSRSNTTKEVAKYIQTQLNCDMEEIIPKTNYNGKIGYIRGAKDGATGKIIEINNTQYNPSDYDLVIIGGPIWASKMANPIVSYVSNNSETLPDLKIFAVAKSNGFDGAFKQLSEISGKTPIKTHNVYEKEIKNGSFKENINEFLV